MSRKATILVVDDDRTMLQSLTEMVEGLGYEVVAASSWTEALRAFRQSGRNRRGFGRSGLKKSVRSFRKQYRTDF